MEDVITNTFCPIISFDFRALLDAELFHEIMQNAE
jgi:hypothetical protein